MQDGYTQYGYMPLTKGDFRDCSKEVSVSQMSYDAKPLSDDGSDDAQDGLDIVQFTSATYYLDEGEGILEVDVMRIGSRKGRSTVAYKTLDGSAQAGSAYEATQGVLIFEAGEHMKTFKVTSIEDDLWAPTLEFQISLDQPSGCMIGKYLGVCRVKVMNDDCFPTKHPDKQDVLAHLGPRNFSLWLEYLRLNWNQPGVAWRAVAVMLGDQLYNLGILSKIVINIYLVDVVFNVKEETEDRLLWPRDRVKTALLLGLLYILRAIILHLWGLAKFYLDVGGKSTEYLRESLFRRYLNYNEESRTKIKPPEITAALEGDCSDLASSYTCALGMVSHLVKVVMLYSLILGEDANRVTLAAMFGMPAFMMVFACCRANAQLRLSGDLGDEEIKLKCIRNDTVKNYPLVAAYCQRPRMNGCFSDQIAKVVKKTTPLNIFVFQNEFVPEALSVFAIGAFMAFRAQSVLNGEASLGSFLATISVFQDIGDAFSTIYTDIIQLTSALDPLSELVLLLNLDTDLADNKTRMRQARELTKTHLLETIKETSSGLEGSTTDAQPSIVAADRLEVSMTNMCFAFSKEKKPFFENVSVSVKQGRSIAIFGAHGTGKTTLLRILGQQLFPTAGTFFIPTHLRVLFVSKDCYFTDEPIFENIAFGTHMGLHDQDDFASEANRERARKVMALLYMPNVLGIMEHQLRTGKNKTSAYNKDGAAPEATEKRELSWQDSITSSERAKLHLARALFMNPEVMLAERMFSHFYGPEEARVMHCLTTYVSHKGVCLPSHEMASRRPRTLFFTPETSDQAKQADDIWTLVLNPLRQARNEYDGGQILVSVHSSKELDIDVCLDQTLNVVQTGREERT